MCSNKQDVKLELVKLRRHGHNRHYNAVAYPDPQGNPDHWMGEGLKTQIWWIDRKQLANTLIRVSQCTSLNTSERR